MKLVTQYDVHDWWVEGSDLAAGLRSIGLESEDLTDSAMPYHLRVAIESLSRDPATQVTRTAHASNATRQAVSIDQLSSISFFSLCKGLFLPLNGLNESRVADLFGFVYRPQGISSRELIESFFTKEIGLDFVQRIACVLGDPFFGRRGMFRRDSLVRLLQSLSLQSRSSVMEELTQVGDVAVLFARHARVIKHEDPLTAVEVLEALRPFPDLVTTDRFDVLRSLLERMGRLEAYYLTKLVLRNAGFGFEYQGELLADCIAKKFHIAAESVHHAIALTDPIRVARELHLHGPEGLKSIQLQPLSPIRPALASSGMEKLTKFPVWVERKYDGIRLLLHKSTDVSGATLCGAYTRNKNDWLELVPGLDRSIGIVPAQNAIIDGELYGTIVDLDGPRPASVYEVYSMLQGETSRPLQLKFAAFDLLYLNSQDLTHHPLHVRRHGLMNLLSAMAYQPTPLPISLADGQLANNKDDLNRLFHHFRAQGYEGIIAKDLQGPYLVATRDPTWIKRKPEITLDLVITGGTMAVTSKEKAGMFGSYVVSAKSSDDPSGYEIVGDVAGLDVTRDRQIQNDVVQQGLLTGRKFERQSASGARPGWEFVPHIVVTVRFEGVIRENVTGQLSLRDPKIVMIRSDKPASECDSVRNIEELYLSQRLT